MSRYDGLIIPRSYSEYINKTDAATLQQALQLSGVLSGTVAAGDNKAVKSSAVANELGTNYYNKQSVDNAFVGKSQIYICGGTYTTGTGEGVGNIIIPNPFRATKNVVVLGIIKEDNYILQKSNVLNADNLVFSIIERVTGNFADNVDVKMDYIVIGL